MSNKYFKTRANMFYRSFVDAGRLDRSDAREDNMGTFTDMASFEGFQSLADDPNMNNLMLDATRADEEIKAHKDFFQIPWNKAEMAQSKIDLLETETEKNRAKIDNLMHFKNVRGDAIKKYQHLEDMAKMGVLSNKHVVREYYKGLSKCDKLLRNRDLLIRSGHSWSGIAALKNNLLSLLQNMGEMVQDKAYVTYQGKVIDHEYTNEVAREERDGQMWQQEILMHFYDQVA